MEIENIKKYFLDFEEKDFLNLINRDEILIDSNKIISVIGSRRVGKTFFLYQKINELIKNGISKKNILYLNFENPFLSELTYKDFNKLVEIFWTLHPEKVNEKLFVFIDEPQVIDKWEIAIRSLYDDYNFQIYITGSSSKLLSKEISTTLRGRSIPYLLLPLSFKEFLKFKLIDFKNKVMSTKEKSILMNSFLEFLKYGSFPEIALSKDNIEKENIIKTYLDLTLYKDIIDRYKIKNTYLIQNLIKTIIKTSGKEISIHKIYLDYKSNNFNVSKDTIYEYISLLEDSFFCYLVKRYTKNRKEEKTISKIYLNNLGFYNYFSIEDYGKRLENSIYLYLLKQINKNPFMKINYWRDNSEKEVDFVVSNYNKPICAIQSSYEINERTTFNREIVSLINCMKELNISKGFIITNDYEKEIKEDKFFIKIVPYYKFEDINFLSF